MKRMSIIALCCTVLFVGNASAVITWDFNYTTAGDGTLTTPYSGAIVDNYDSGRPGWNYSGNFDIVSGSSSTYAAPYNSTLMLSGPDATDYLTTPKDGTQNWSTVYFNRNTYNYLGLFWGSIDYYNQIEFLNNNTVVASYTGTQILNPNPANGDQSAPSTNLYVNFYNVPDFDTVRFTSTYYAFELDNLAVIPVPGSLLLGMIGLGALRLKFRRLA